LWLGGSCKWCTCVCRCISTWSHCPPREVLLGWHWLPCVWWTSDPLSCRTLLFGWVGPCWCLVSSLYIYDFY
jgi:hypothetical protein